MDVVRLEPEQLWIGHGEEARAHRQGTRGRCCASGSPRHRASSLRERARVAQVQEVRPRADSLSAMAAADVQQVELQDAGSFPTGLVSSGASPTSTSPSQAPSGRCGHRRSVQRLPGEALGLPAGQQPARRAATTAGRGRARGGRDGGRHEPCEVGVVGGDERDVRAGRAEQRRRAARARRPWWRSAPAGCGARHRSPSASAGRGPIRCGSGRSSSPRWPGRAGRRAWWRWCADAARPSCASRTSMVSPAAAAADGRAAICCERERCRRLDEPAGACRDPAVPLHRARRDEGVGRRRVRAAGRRAARRRSPRSASRSGGGVEEQDVAGPRRQQSVVSSIVAGLDAVVRAAARGVAT